MPFPSLRVLITRPLAQAPELVSALQAQGLETLICPAIEVFPLALTGVQEADLRAHLPMTDWLVFTSVNGVKAWQTLPDALRQFLPSHCRVAVTGPRTAAAAVTAGLTVGLCPAEHTGQALAEALLAYAPQQVVALRAQDARPELPALLAAHHIPLYDLPIYTTHAVPMPPRIPPVDVITFTSPSAVQAFAAWGEIAHQALAQAKIAVIGPTTAVASFESFGRVDIQAAPYTIPGLVQALTHAYQGVA